MKLKQDKFTSEDSMYNLFFFASYSTLLRTVFDKKDKIEDAGISAVAITSFVMLCHIISIIILLSLIIDTDSLIIQIIENKVWLAIIINVVLFLYNRQKLKRINNNHERYQKLMTKHKNMDWIIEMAVLVPSVIICLYLIQLFKSLYL